MSDSWRDRTADSIAKAIDTYFSTHLADDRAGTK
jgi:N-acetylmuramoyl-L-alanine amidase